MVLYQGDIEPRDCVQGQLRDCWLVSALACLAEYPGAVKQVILNREKSLRESIGCDFTTARPSAGLSSPWMTTFRCTRARTRPSSCNPTTMSSGLS